MTIFQDIVREKQTRMYVACAAFNPPLSVIQEHSCFHFFFICGQMSETLQ